jgi:hypothetical protein
VLFLWDALSDERSGLSPVSHCHQCLVHCLRFNIIYIVHVTCFKYSASHSKEASENVGLHLHVTGGAGNVLYVQCTLDLLQLCQRTRAQLFAAVITRAHVS